jgi:RNA polymerase sigma factor for flagellar operon FliA
MPSLRHRLVWMSRTGLSLAARHHAAPRPDAPTAASADQADIEDFLLDNLSLIDDVIRFVCRRHNHKGSAAENEEFASEVKLKMVERQYEVLRRFEGRSSLRTYLTVVIARLYLDYCNQRWGKWRASAEARRLGPIAIQLETLMVRDGLGFGEASRVLLHRQKVGVTEDELLTIASRLPMRVRRVMIGEQALETEPSQQQADATAHLADRRAAAARIGFALHAALGGLAQQEQLILRLRFLDGLAIADIARVLHLESKPLYRRLEAVLKNLRQALRRAGVSEAEARDVLEGTMGDIGLAFMWKPASAPDEAPSVFSRAERRRDPRDGRS